MASERISDMPTAAAISGSDFLPIVHLGGNYKVTRDVLLVAQPGEDLNLLSDAAQIQIDQFGQIEILPGGGFGAQITQSLTGATLGVTGTGGIVATAGTGQVASMASGSGQINIFATGHITIISGDGLSVVVIYHPVIGGNWAGAAPATMHDALERLASAVRGLLGAPIP